MCDVEKLEFEDVSPSVSGPSLCRLGKFELLDRVGVAFSRIELHCFAGSL